MNKVTLIGNLTADPEIRRLNDGNKVANLRMATNENWTDKTTGERKSRTEWHRLVTFTTPLIEAIIEKYARKGKQVAVEGELRTRKWVDQSGTERYTTEIFIGPRGSLMLLGASPNSNASAAAAAASPVESADDTREPAAPPAEKVANDDIPF